MIWYLVYNYGLNDWRILKMMQMAIAMAMAFVISVHSDLMKGGRKRASTRLTINGVSSLKYIYTKPSIFANESICARDTKYPFPLQMNECCVSTIDNFNEYALRIRLKSFRMVSARKPFISMKSIPLACAHTHTQTFKCTKEPSFHLDRVYF